MWLLWLIIGFFIGVAVAWYFLSQRLDEQARAIDGNWEARLRHANDEVRRADQAHEETKEKLREMLADRAGTGMAPPLAPATPVTPAQAPALMLGDVAPPPGAPAQALGLVGTIDPAPIGVSPTQALKQVEAKLAMLPAGSNARIALMAERDRLAAEVKALGPTSAPAVASVEPAAAAMPATAAAAPTAPARDPLARKLAEIDAKLAMLPASSSARAALVEQRARLLAGSTAPLTVAASGIDDLTIILGIGPVLGAKLNALGITTFRQLALLTPEEVARINADIDFPGRIEREKWIEQARELAAS